EKNPDTGQMERFVYVQRGNGFEKRTVKVGVADFFYAEIQEGLSAGEVVALEMPKEEREKKAQALASQNSRGEGRGPGSAATNRVAGAPGGGGTVSAGSGQARAGGGGTPEPKAAGTR
ncbi:MAG TPA: hypothetical protein P5233_16690, partial [Candidatus Paceibacterota bacterium]|nr:hypothetical protein [Candidatus Paceibacterota bacterium]